MWHVENVQPSHWPSQGCPSCHMWKYAISIRRPSKTSSSGTGPSGPVTVTGGMSVIGNRRRAAAIASPSRVCAFSRARISSRAARQVARSTTGGVACTSIKSSAAGPGTTSPETMLLRRTHRPSARPARLSCLVHVGRAEGASCEGRDGRGEGLPSVILPKVRDPRFVTIRRGGTLTDADHQLLALWAASCAGHVLDLFEAARPDDPRPRHAIEQARAWARGEIRMSEARAAGGHAMAAARDLKGPARHAAYAAGQAAAVAHVAAHELGAAAYAIKAARAAALDVEGEAAGRLECRWQREQLPDA